MYELIECAEPHRTAWNQFAVAYGTVFHRIEWKDVLEQVFGYRALYLMAIDEHQQITALLPLCLARDLRLRRVAVSLPFINYLDVCHCDERAYHFIKDQLAGLAARYNCYYLELRLKDQEPVQEGVGCNRDNVTFMLPLEGDEEAILARGAATNRRRSRKAEREGLFEVSFEPHHLEAFYRVFRQRMQQLGSPAPGKKLFTTIRDRLGDSTTLLSVLDRKRQRVVGGMFLLASGDTIHYQWGATVGYNTANINYFMYRRAIRYALQRGYKYLDLGRSPYREDHSGTYAFKAQFGAVPHQLKYVRYGPGGHDWHNAAGQFGACVELWKRLPAPLTNTIGPPLIKYVLP